MNMQLSYITTNNITYLHNGWNIQNESKLSTTVDKNQAYPYWVVSTQ